MEFIALPGLPLVNPGDDVSELVLNALQASSISLEDGDVIVVAQKIISKAEDRYVFLRDVIPSDEAQALAQEVDKDPRLVELILSESCAVIRKRPGVLIVEHKLGYVHANAGIDQSNISQQEGERALLLPLDSDKSAAILCDALQSASKKNIAVLINDSAGRAWRNGTVGMTVGLSGFEPVWDMVGDHDLFGNELRVTTVAVADELAAGASLLMGQGGEACPVVIVKNAPLQLSKGADSKGLIRDAQMDLFR